MENSFDQRRTAGEGPTAIVGAQGGCRGTCRLGSAPSASKDRIVGSRCQPTASRSRVTPSGVRASTSGRSVIGVMNSMTDPVAGAKQAGGPAAGIGSWDGSFRGFLGPVDTHRAAITPAARWIAAAKRVSVVLERVAMARNAVRWTQRVSIAWRLPDQSRSCSLGYRRFHCAGLTAAIAYPHDRDSCGFRSTHPLTGKATPRPVSCGTSPISETVPCMTGGSDRNQAVAHRPLCGHCSSHWGQVGLIQDPILNEPFFLLYHVS